MAGFLLSLTPKGDGSIPVEEQEIMRGIGRWLKAYGEAIYGTEPWTAYAEGPTVTRGMKKNAKGDRTKTIFAASAKALGTAIVRFDGEELLTIEILNPAPKLLIRARVRCGVVRTG